MEQELLSMSHAERIRRLESICDHVTEEEVPVPVDEDQRQELQKSITHITSQISQKKAEKKAYVSNMNKEIKELNEALESDLQIHRTGVEMKQSTIYEVQNHDTGMLEEYTHEGRLLRSRRMPKLTQLSTNQRLGNE